MPWWSRYKLLLADDDELADLARTHGVDGGRAPGPRLREWDPGKEIIAEIRDVAARLEAAIVNSNRAKGSRTVRPKPSARPLTAAQRAERRSDYAHHQDIVSRVLPRG